MPCSLQLGPGTVVWPSLVYALKNSIDAQCSMFFKIYLYLCYLFSCHGCTSNPCKPEAAFVCSELPVRVLGVKHAWPLSHLSLQPQHCCCIQPRCFILYHSLCFTARRLSDVSISQFAYLDYFLFETKSLCKYGFSLIFRG